MLNSPCMFQGNMTSRDMCFPIILLYNHACPLHAIIIILRLHLLKCMYTCFWNCHGLSCPREYNYITDYDIQGYAFPLMTMSFMRTAKVCTL